MTGCPDPAKERVTRRVTFLPDYTWSSWRMYAGLEPAASWLCRERLQGRQGGRSLKQQRRSLWKHTEAPLRQGKLESPSEQRVGGVILGDAEEAEQVLKDLQGNPVEQTPARRVARTSRPAWSELVSASEGLLDRTWPNMTNKHGDWGAQRPDGGGDGSSRCGRSQA